MSQNKHTKAPIFTRDKQGYINLGVTFLLLTALGFAITLLALFNINNGYNLTSLNVFGSNQVDASQGKNINNNRPLPTVTATNPSSGSCGGSGGGCGCGGGNRASVNTNTTPVVAQTTKDISNQEAIQIIKTTYTAAKYLDPGVFKVKAGVKVKLEIDVRDDGTGCGNAITISGLYNQAEPLQTGVPITMEFTPTTPGTYNITCGMGMIHFGSITVE